MEDESTCRYILLLLLKANCMCIKYYTNLTILRIKKKTVENNYTINVVGYNIDLLLHILYSIKKTVVRMISLD